MDHIIQIHSYEGKRRTTVNDKGGQHLQKGSDRYVRQIGLYYGSV